MTAEKPVTGIDQTNVDTLILCSNPACQGNGSSAESGSVARALNNLPHNLISNHQEMPACHMMQRT
jgi:hypothetical protein